MSQHGKTADVQESARPPSEGNEHRSRIEQLFRDHHDDLIRFLSNRFAAHDAREAAAEAFAKLLSVDSSAVGYLRAFLFKAATNIAIDGRRSARVKRRARADIPLLMYEIVDHRTPERRVSGDQQLQRIESLVESMPPKCRTAFVMHQIEGMDYRDIAFEMGLTESMVRKYVERGLLYCRAHLDLEANNEPQ